MTPSHVFLNSYWVRGMTASSLFSKRKKSAGARSGEEGGMRKDRDRHFGQERLDFVDGVDKQLGEPSC